MSAVRYLPGEDWLSVVRAGVVVLVPAATAPGVIDRLWNQLGENPNLQSVLPIVAGGFGQGLDSMPPFGVVSHASRLHVLLRGEVRLSVTTGDGDAGAVELSGEHVTTWTERIFDGDGHRFTLSAGSNGADEDAGAGTSFPLEAGIVRASVVSAGSGGPGSSSGSDGSAGSGSSDTAPAAAAEATPAAAAQPAPAVLPAPPVVVSETALPDSAFGGTEAEDPERAMTGALEAEESATINPSLYLTSHDGGDEPGSHEDGGDEPGSLLSGADEPGSPLPGADEPHSPESDPELRTTGYDHLWDQTVVRRVEDAAVRPPEEEDLPEASSGAGPDATEQGASSPATGAEAEASGVAPVQPSSVLPGSASMGSSSPEPTPIPLSAPGQLIDSVPWARKSSGTEQAHAPTPVIGAPSAPGALAIPGSSAPAVETGRNRAPSGPDSDDHDGQTVMRSDLRAPARPQAQPPSEQRPATGPLVLARLCPQGHANPPEAPDCGVCSQPLDSEPREVRRPSLGTMQVSTGEVVELDQSLIVGRQPSVSRVQGRGMPKLVQVTSAGGDISRSHVEVRLDGWHVLLCDLKATNGTVLIRAGQPPRRLGEGETAFLLDGDVAQLGDDVFLRFEGLR